VIEPAQVAVVIPTRGNVDMEPILAAYAGFGFSPGYVWNNSADPDLGVYGRYAAISSTVMGELAAVIITQDDDVILPRETIQALLDAYEPGKVVCNIPQRFRQRYRDSGMVGFGAIFDRDLPRQAFNRFYSAQRAFEDVGQSKTWMFSVADHLEPVSEATIHRTCDLVFTMLTPMTQVDLPYVELAYGKDETRMWRQPGHFDERDRMRKLCREVRDG
jgi:hypothetical protein